MSGIGGHVSGGQRRYDREARRAAAAPFGWREQLEAWRQQLLAQGVTPGRLMMSMPRQEGRTAFLRELVATGRLRWAGDSITAAGPPYTHRFGRSSWECQHDPPCPHPAYVHDIEDYDDQRPTCCADGCTCGRSAVAPGGPSRMFLPTITMFERA